MSNEIIVPMADPEFKPGSGVTISFSYQHLVDALKARGYLRNSEECLGVKVTETGVQFYIENTK